MNYSGFPEVKTGLKVQFCRTIVARVCKIAFRMQHSFNIFVRMEGFVKTTSSSFQFLKGGLLCLLLSGILIAPLSLFSQSGDLPKVQLMDSKIQWLGMDLDGSHLTLKYDIPYNGVVELRLFDPKGVKIFQNYYINEFGKNSIVLKRNKFIPGESYVCVLNYKIDEIKQTIVIPGSGDNMAQTP